MTNVTVSLNSGVTRTFNTAHTTQAAVEQYALTSGNIASLPIDTRLALSTLLLQVFAGHKDGETLQSDALAAAGVRSVQVGDVDRLSLAKSDDSETPVFAQLEAENNGHDFADDDDDNDFYDVKPVNVVTRTLAIVAAAAAAVVGVVAGALIW